MKMEGEGDWNAPMHVGLKCRLGRKIHISLNEETFEIYAIEAMSSSIDDAPALPDLLNHVPPDEEIGSVAADCAYDTRKCHVAICPFGHSTL